MRIRQHGGTKAVPALQGYAVKKIAEYASNRGFTNLIVLNENRKEVNGLLLVHLPNGPTAQFRLANLKLAREIKVCDRLPRACMPLPCNLACTPSACHPCPPHISLATELPVHPTAPSARQGHARATHHKPEVILNNFDTVIGQRVGRLLASLFSQDSAFKGRQVATFHNQRDFIFFRRAPLVARGPLGALSGHVTGSQLGRTHQAPSLHL